MIIERFDAISSLVGGGLAGQPNGTGMKYLDGQTPPTEAEIDAEIIRLDKEYSDNEYQRDRQYLTWQEQMDQQYHDLLDGTTTWKDAIAKVKEDNPKPDGWKE